MSSDGAVWDGHRGDLDRQIIATENECCSDPAGADQAAGELRALRAAAAAMDRHAARAARGEPM